MPFGDEDETGETKPAAVPATENPSASRRRSVANPVSIDDLSPTGLSRCRRRLAGGVARALGPRANALEENGLSWRDAETQAFVEVWNQFRSQAFGTVASGARSQ